jgi:hypothetical protein
MPEQVKSRPGNWLRKASTASTAAAMLLPSLFGGSALAGERTENDFRNSCPKYYEGPNKPNNAFYLCQEFVESLNGYPGPPGDPVYGNEPMAGAKAHFIASEHGHDPTSRDLGRSLLHARYLFNSRVAVANMVRGLKESTYKLETGDVTVTGISLNMRAKRAYVWSQQHWKLVDTEKTNDVCAPTRGKDNEECVVYQDDSVHINTLCRVHDSGSERYVVVEEFKQPGMNCLKVARAVLTGRYK